MAEDITFEQALEKLEQIAEEWVDKDLERGIALPFRHWRGGRYKELLSLSLWRNVIVPIIFTIVVFMVAKMGEWKLFAVLLPCYIIYWIIGIWIHKREEAGFILRPDGITIATPRDRTFIPWEAVNNITSTVSANGYKLVIQAGNKYYTFYEVYAKTLVCEPDGRVNPAKMPLHIAYKVINAARRKVNNC